MTVVASIPNPTTSSAAELPLFEDAVVAWDKPDYRKQGEGDNTHFVRAIRLKIEIAREFPLATILERTEQEFLKVSAYTGAVILPHVWGLVPKPADVSLLDDCAFRTNSHPELPDDVVLAARVETIRGITPFTREERTRLHHGFYRYHCQYLADYDKKQHLVDVAAAGQYSKGWTESIPEPAIILHDIEPLIKLQ